MGELQNLVFTSARDSELWGTLIKSFPWVEGYDADRESKRKPPMTIVEAMLLVVDWPSQSYAITCPTAYKVVNWARNIGLIGAGNQIAESGLVLRSLLPEDGISGFRDGDVRIWNPFEVMDRERIFFASLLCEIDELTVAILDDIGNLSPDVVIPPSKASEMTCRAFLRVLDQSGDKIPPSALPQLRTARDLALVMAEELQLDNVPTYRPRSQRARLPSQKSNRLPGGGRRAGSQRRPSKNVDHQAVPRFEQLVDLGFLSKQSNQLESVSDLKARRAWTYQRTAMCDQWRIAREQASTGAKQWSWQSLATVFAPRVEQNSEERRSHIAAYIWRGYQKISRPVGHTPFHSVALLAMIEAAIDGHCLEMKDIHDFMLLAKREGLLEACVSFASGNDIDKMFVSIKSGFQDEVAALDAPATKGKEK